MLRSSSLWGAAPGVPNSPGVHADLPGGTLRYGISGADDHWHLDRLDSLGCGGILRARDERHGPGADLVVA